MTSLTKFSMQPAQLNMNPYYWYLPETLWQNIGDNHDQRRQFGPLAGSHEITKRINEWARANKSPERQVHKLQDTGHPARLGRFDSGTWNAELAE
jgi:hypothetical protein